MSDEVTGWLPPSVLRRQAIEEQRDAKTEREAQRAKAAAATEAHDRAIAAYMAGAASRGEDIAAMDAANGNLGRTVPEILAGTAAEVADRVPKGDRNPVNLIDPPARRSAPADP